MASPSEPLLGILTSTDAAKVLARAAAKLCVPAGSVVHGDLIVLPPGATPNDVTRLAGRSVRACHMRVNTDCRNEPHCSEAGECVLFLATGLRVGPYVLRHADDGMIEILNDGEGGHFRLSELSEVIGRFVSERL